METALFQSPTYTKAIQSEFLKTPHEYSTGRSVWEGLRLHCLEPNTISTGCILTDTIPFALHGRGDQRPGRAQVPCGSSLRPLAQFSWADVSPEDCGLRRVKEAQALPFSAGRSPAPPTCHSRLEWA